MVMFGQIEIMGASDMLAKLAPEAKIKIDGVLVEVNQFPGALFHKVRDGRAIMVIGGNPCFFVEVEEDVEVVDFEMIGRQVYSFSAIAASVLFETKKIAA